MKKSDWKHLLIGSLVAIALYLVGVIYFLIDALTYKGHYPYPTIAGDVTNWFDRFIVESWFILLPFTPIFIIAIVLVIISIIKMKKLNK